MSSTITVTEAVRSFSDVIARVYYKHESFDIKKGNYIVAKLTPIDSQPINSQSTSITELNKLFAQSPGLIAQDLDRFEKDIQSTQTVLKTFQNSWD